MENIETVTEPTSARGYFPENIGCRLRDREVSIQAIGHYVRGIFRLSDHTCFVSFREEGEKLEILIRGGQVKIWNAKLKELLVFVGSKKIVTNFCGDSCPHCGNSEQMYRLVIK